MVDRISRWTGAADCARRAGIPAIDAADFAATPGGGGSGEGGDFVGPAGAGGVTGATAATGDASREGSSSRLHPSPSSARSRTPLNDAASSLPRRAGAAGGAAMMPGAAGIEDPAGPGARSAHGPASMGGAPGIFV